MDKAVILSYFARYIEQELGIVYADHNIFQLENRLQEISARFGGESLEALYERAKAKNAAELLELILDVSTNNETSFFRDPKIFAAIAEVCIKAHVSRPGSAPLSIWSAACSTGQEPLSLVMLIKKLQDELQTEIPFRLLASDISARALEVARQGLYTGFELQRGLSEDFIKKFFSEEEGNKWRASAELMKHIEHRRLNLRSEISHSYNYDLILCRNILIYQNVEGKREIVDAITQWLKPGGFLVLGSGESLIGLSGDYEQVENSGAILYQRKERGVKAS